MGSVCKRDDRRPRIESQLWERGLGPCTHGIGVAEALLGSKRRSRINYDDIVPDLLSEGRQDLPHVCRAGYDEADGRIERMYEIVPFGHLDQAAFARG